MKLIYDQTGHRTKESIKIIGSFEKVIRRHVKKYLKQGYNPRELELALIRACTFEVVMGDMWQSMEKSRKAAKK